jgi:hypothetical protein
VAEYFDWDKKAEWTRDAYRQVLDRRHVP